jgi:hypothetical protein
VSPPSGGAWGKRCVCGFVWGYVATESPLGAIVTDVSPPSGGGAWGGTWYEIIPFGCAWTPVRGFIVTSDLQLSVPILFSAGNGDKRC